MIHFYATLTITAQIHWSSGNLPSGIQLGYRLQSFHVQCSKQWIL